MRMTGTRMSERPRVLRLGEIPEFDGAVLIEFEGKPACETWALYQSEMLPGFRFLAPMSTVLWLPLADYGVKWRAWDRRPGATDRARVKWGREA